MSYALGSHLVTTRSIIFLLFINMEPTILHKVFIDVFGRYGFMPEWSYSLLFLLGILITPRFF